MTYLTTLPGFSHSQHLTENIWRFVKPKNIWHDTILLNPFSVQCGRLCLCEWSKEYDSIQAHQIEPKSTQLQCEPRTLNAVSHWKYTQAELPEAVTQRQQLGVRLCGLFYSLFINCVFWFALQGWMHIKPEQYSIHSFRNFSHKNHLKQGSKGQAKYFRVCVCREWKSRAAAGREASEHTSVCTHSELQNNQKTPNQSSFCLWVCVGGVVLDKQLMWASY